MTDATRTASPQPEAAGPPEGMAAARYLGAGAMSVTPLEPRPPGPGEVQVRVAYTGLCGTDLHVLHGHMDHRVGPPAVIGHEMSGVISAVGDGVDGWAAGDRVTVMPLDWDSSCPACLAGHQHICHNLTFIGIDSPGSLQSLWNVPAATLIPLPDDLSLAHAALVEPVAVAVHDVRRAELRPGERAVVIGGGPIGVQIATVARHAGADVVVAEVDRRRRQQLQEWGFATIDPTSEDQAAWVTRWSEGVGADVAFEVSGSAAAVLAATSLLRVRGRLVVVAIHPEPRPIDLQRVFWRELSIVGARVYQRADFERAVELLSEGVVPAADIITKIVPLTEVAQAFAELERGLAMKILVDVAAVSESVGATP